jgi:hypothetical protein
MILHLTPSATESDSAHNIVTFRPSGNPPSFKYASHDGIRYLIARTPIRLYQSNYYLLVIGVIGTIKIDVNSTRYGT